MCEEYTVHVCEEYTVHVCEEYTTSVSLATSMLMRREEWGLLALDYPPGVCKRTPSMCVKSDAVEAHCCVNI